MKILLTFSIVLSVTNIAYAEKPKESLPKVYIEKYQKQEIYRFGEYYGRIRPKFETKVFSPISGTFEQLNVRPGQKVQKNQVIAKIKAIDYANEMRPMSIRSPFHGIIAGPLPTVGQFINKHQLILKVYKENDFIADINMAHEDASHISIGHPTSIKVNDNELMGKIITIGQQIDSLTGTVKCEVEFNNSKNKIKPGSLAKTIVKYDHRDSFAIPRKYIHRNGKQQVVYTTEKNEKKANQLKAIPIEISGRFKDLLEIKTEQNIKELSIVTKSTLKHLSEGKEVEEIKPKSKKTDAKKDKTKK